MRLYIVTIKKVDGEVYFIEKKGNSSKEVLAEIEKNLKWFEKVERIRRVE